MSRRASLAEERRGAIACYSPEILRACEVGGMVLDSGLGRDEGGIRDDPSSLL